ncbi:MAG TPA: DUF262 domain-containing protein, partial [Chthonomonadaceae bacterium]|nr:DUF262 domain-containing protein [Chthonomonadaceae bacterium]
MPHNVNLDALIHREDFEVMGEPPSASKLAQGFRVSDLAEGALTLALLRKPDFQRETNNWSPRKVADLIKSFLEGDLIPAVILWRSDKSGNFFVVDGAHRLSALIAWALDDYGDGKLSRVFFDNHIPPEQNKAAEETRKLVNKEVGSYQELSLALRYLDTTPTSKSLSENSESLRGRHGISFHADPQSLYHRSFGRPMALDRRLLSCAA